MGLDSVELVLATEEEFGITIDDADAANLATPRQLADYVVSRLGVRESGTLRCSSQAAFYRIRSVLVKEFGARRGDVRPGSPIDHWLQGSVRSQWLTLVTSCGMTQVPDLQCRKSVHYPLTLGTPAVAASLLLLTDLPRWTPVLAFVMLWLAANVAAGRIADVIPPALRTVSGLVPYVRPPQHEDWSPDYVLRRVIQITSRQIGIPVEKIRPDDHFVKDLGID